MALILVVMGVSGCGKSTVANELARRLKFDFIEGDDLHSDENLEKMSSGVPLSDEDRLPWLLTLRAKAVQLIEAAREQDSSPSNPRPTVVVACSALKKSYRDILRGVELDRSSQGLKLASHVEITTCLIYLKGSPSLIERRMKDRRDHFMGAHMLGSQLQTLEEPNPEVEDSNNSSTITIPLESGSDKQEKKMSDLIEEIIAKLNEKGYLVAIPLNQAVTTLSNGLPPISQVVGPTAGPQAKETLSLLFEVSESIDRCLIPILRRTESPILDYQQLISLCRHIVQEQFDIEDKVSFLGSHPRIGEVKGLSQMSSKEQQNHKPTDPQVLQELERLNQIYETVYPGLRYVTFVNGRSRTEIMHEMQEHLYPKGDKRESPVKHDRDQEWFNELSRGIDDVFKIAESRRRLLQS